MAATKTTIDKKKIRQLLYPILLAGVVFISLFIFALSLKFLIGAITDTLFASPIGGENAVRFQTENLTPLKRHLSDIPPDIFR